MTEVFRVQGGARLTGHVDVTGAKNSALKLMAAALLAEGRTVVRAVPQILDVDIMAAVLRALGCQVDVAHGAGVEGGSVTVDVPATLTPEAPYELVRRMRATIAVLGPLTARCREARVALPGGDAIGSRGLDMHMSGLTALGAELSVEHGAVVSRAPGGLRGARVALDFPSVGATENLMMAAVLARGTTVVENAAREPELVDLAEMLNAMGARVEGAGTSEVVVDGVDGLAPVEHRTVPDRIVAGTWAVAAALTRGDVDVRGGLARHLELPLDKLVTAGAVVSVRDDGFRVTAERRPRAVDVQTLPYPGFPTDLQPAFIALDAVADGTAMVTENVFEARFMFVDEMARLGADVKVDGHHAVVRGREELSGAPVTATDIRAGAGLVLAGLVADGTTDVHEVHHVDRGYPHLVGALQGLGADVRRVELPDLV